MRSKLLIGGLAVVVAFLLATSPLVAQAAGFISSADIINNTIKSADVKNNSLKGKDIKDNKLTGADVNEATLGTVPSASSASNASNLNGEPATSYQDRVAFTSADVGSPVAVSSAADTQILGPLNLTVPAGVSFAHATGNATFAGPETTLYMYVQQDAACGAAGAGFTNRVFSSTNGQSETSMDFVFAVTPGVHTYRLCALVGAAGVSAFNRTLAVETVAKGATGGSTITRPESKGSGPSGTSLR